MLEAYSFEIRMSIFIRKQMRNSLPWYRNGYLVGCWVKTGMYVTKVGQKFLL